MRLDHCLLKLCVQTIILFLQYLNLLDPLVFAALMLQPKLLVKTLGLSSISLRQMHILFEFVYILFLHLDDSFFVSYG